MNNSKAHNLSKKIVKCRGRRPPTKNELNHKIDVVQTDLANLNKLLNDKLLELNLKPDKAQAIKDEITLIRHKIGDKK